jgi:hypothetical protein
MVERDKRPPLQLGRPKTEEIKLLPNQGAQEVKKITLEKPTVKLQESSLPKESTISTTESVKKTSSEPTPKLEIKKKVKEKLSGWADVAGVWLFWNLAIHQIMPQIEPDYPEGYDVETRRIMKNPNVVPFLIGTHRGLEDLIAIAKLSKKNTHLTNEARGVETSFWKILGNDFKDAFAGNLLKDPPEDKKPFQGFKLTIAGSLDAEVEGKKQSAIMTELINQLRNHWMPKYNLGTDIFIRAKDKTEFEMTNLNNKDYDRRFAQRLLSNVGPAPAFFPEATMESGRKTREGNEQIQILDKNIKLYKEVLKVGKKTLKIISLPIKEIVRSVFPRQVTVELEKFMQESTNGMQEFDKSIKFDRILDFLHKHGKKAVFFLVADNNAFKIIDPNIKNHPMIAWEAILAEFNPLNTLPIQLTLGILYSMLDLKIKGMMDVKVAMPITDEEMYKKIIEDRTDLSLKDKKPTSLEINNFLGKRMARMLPENLRGYYK